MRDIGEKGMTIERKEGRIENRGGRENEKQGDFES